MSKVDYKSGLAELLDVFPPRKEVPKWCPTSIELLRWIGQKARLNGYGDNLRLKPEVLFKYLAQKRDEILNSSADGQHFENLRINYICQCIEEFKEFAMLDEVISNYIAEIKSKSEKHKKLSPDIRKMISIILNPIFPKYQGYRGGSQVSPFLLKFLHKKDYDGVLKSLHPLKPVNKQNNKYDRKIKIERVAKEYLKTKGPSCAIPRLPKVDKFALKNMSFPANKIALNLVAWALDIKSSTLYKALRSKYPLNTL